jgi:DNA-binding MarR family transcriptional regulator
VRDKADRRNNLIFLTDEGKRLREMLVPIAINELRKALNNISEKEIDTLTILLKKVYNNLKTDKCIEN